VWRFTCREAATTNFSGRAINGAGGASRAFAYADSRRAREIECALGFAPFYGSLNLRLSRPFDWSRDYYRAQMFDVANRSLGLDSEWVLRWARFYPVTISNVPAFAFRFEGERYRRTFVELIAAVRLRDIFSGNRVLICQ
jgi:CTP-dependent riboflavin kinase